MKETTTCPKCLGRGYIGEFNHIANGVCFMCAGNGTIEIDRAKLIAGIDKDARIKAEWILASTPESYAGLSYGKQLKIRTFAHGGWGLGEAYPAMRDHWFEVGGPAFSRAQDERQAAHSVAF